MYAFPLGDANFGRTFYLNLTSCITLLIFNPFYEFEGSVFIDRVACYSKKTIFLWVLDYLKGSFAEGKLYLGKILAVSSSLIREYSV